MEKLEKKSLKEKKAYITWEENDMGSSSDSKNEVANLSLMARDYKSDEEIASSNLDSTISVDELQYAFNDLHKECIKLAKLFSSNKKDISNIEKEISKLNKELKEFKLENETLGLIDANSSCTKCLMYENAIKSYSCSSCNKFEKEINGLKNTLAKFTFGKN